MGQKGLLKSHRAASTLYRKNKPKKNNNAKSERKKTKKECSESSLTSESLDSGGLAVAVADGVNESHLDRTRRRRNISNDHHLHHHHHHCDYQGHATTTASLANYSGPRRRLMARRQQQQMEQSKMFKLDSLHRHKKKHRRCCTNTDFLQDPIHEMTLGRRLALRLMKYAWYNPQIKPQQQQTDGDDENDDDDDDDHDDDEAKKQDHIFLESNDDESDDDNDDDDEQKRLLSVRDKRDMMSRSCSIEVFEDDVNSRESSSSQRTFTRRALYDRSSSIRDALAAINNNNNNETWSQRSSSKTTTAKNVDIDRVVADSERPLMVTKKEYPSLEKAWAYFEHVTLPRYLVHEDYKGHGARKRQQFQLTKAEAGETEHPTKLYHPYETHPSQLGDFGLGIGLYFSSVWWVAIVLLLAGILNVPNILHFSGPAYSNYQPRVPPLLKGSAICTEMSWVPCPDCPANKFHPTRYATATHEINAMKLGGGGSSGSSSTTSNSTQTMNPANLTFVLHNDCQGVTIQEGMINFATIWLVVIGMTIVAIRQHYDEIVFDEDEQTPQDYSIHITNPPEDAYDPEEWRAFFRDKCGGSQATAITVGLDNDLLLNTLVQRRECLKRLEMLSEPGTRLDLLSLARLAAQIEKQRSPFERFKHTFVWGIPELFAKIAALNAKIEGLAQLDYQVKHVYCSFEHESHQRKVLAMLLASRYDAKRKQNFSGIKFRNEHVLLVEEAPEPSTILWANLNERFTDLLKVLVTTTLCALVAVVLVAFMIAFLTRTQQSHIVTAIAVALSNVLFTRVAKLLTSFERHSSESHTQTSLFFKINIFRWVNTAIVITYVTPFDKTLAEDGLLKSVRSILFAEIVTQNILHLLDIVGNIKRHILAPRAKTQDQMNLHMKGADIDLAERFANMTKVIFVGLWFSPIYPGALFMSAAGMFLTYYVDRFSLMRTWARKPMFGTTIARFSRHYFLPLAVATNSVVASYMWAGFPYDNLCDSQTIVPTYYVGSWGLRLLDNTTATTVVDFGTTEHRYCPQQISGLDGRKFPASPTLQPSVREWMTEQQEIVVEFFGWTSLAVMALVVWYLMFLMVRCFERFFRAKHEPMGEDQKIPFSAVKSISTYVPQVLSNLHAYPLLGCEVDGIDPNLFDWTDPDNPHVFYDLTKDAKDLVGEQRLGKYHVFSKLAHWPPDALFCGTIKEESTSQFD